MKQEVGIHGVEIEVWQAQQAAYALGALDSDEAQAFEAHLTEGCEHCAAELRKFERVAAALGCEVPQVEPPPGVREKLLASIRENELGESTTYQDTSLQGMIFVRAGEGEWHEMLEGMFVKHLYADEKAGTLTTLLRLRPGTRVPRHHHHGVEQCLVLEGDFHVGNEIFGPGDFQCAMPGSLHDSIYTDGGALVLIVSPADYKMLEQH